MAPQENLAAEMDGTTRLDIEMRCDHRPISHRAIFENDSIQLIHIPDMIGHGEIPFPELLMIEKIDFRRRGFHDAPP